MRMRAWIPFPLLPSLLPPSLISNLNQMVQWREGMLIIRSSCMRSKHSTMRLNTHMSSTTLLNRCCKHYSSTSSNTLWSSNWTGSARRFMLTPRYSTISWIKLMTTKSSDRSQTIHRCQLQPSLSFFCFVWGTMEMPWLQWTLCSGQGLALAQWSIIQNAWW